MRALRLVLVVTGLALCVCAAARGGGGEIEIESESESLRANTDSTRSYRSLFARILKMVRSAQDGGGGEFAQDAEDKENKHHQQQTKSGDQILEVFPRDLRKKEKFLKHLTGPLYFSPKCRKHVYRLYHNTRDCTIPAYYRRCARLLSRLAGSPRCLES